MDQGDIKVDYKVSDKDSISGRFTRAYQNNPSANSYQLIGNGFSTTPIYNTVGDWTRSISPNLVNDARFGWSHITLNNGTSWGSSVGQFGNTSASEMVTLRASMDSGSQFKRQWSPEFGQRGNRREF